MDKIVCFAVDKNEDLPIQEVIRWLKLAADMSPGPDTDSAVKTHVTSFPPVQPKGGEVYIFKPTSVIQESKLLFSIGVSMSIDPINMFSFIL